MEPYIVAAFPKGLGPAARRASEGLASPAHPPSDRLIQDSYGRRWGRVVVDGDAVMIPYRHYEEASKPLTEPVAESVRQAWLTRSWDGKVRQRAVQSLLIAPSSWHVPFVLQLCGEYVIEIGGDIAEYASRSLPGDPSMLDAYGRFWGDNPEFVSLTYARATSYWDAYYRGTVSLNEYPPHRAMIQIEQLLKS